MTISFPFQWAVRQGGYGYLEAAQAAPAHDPAEVGLAAGDIVEHAVAAAKAFNTLHGRKGLFKTFAETRPYEDDIAYFLYRYALNGTGRKLPSSRSVADVVEQVSGQGASITQWVEHRWEMSRLVELWLWVGADDRRRLQRHIQWSGSANGPRRVEYDSRPDAGLPGSLRPAFKDVIASDEVRPEWLRYFKNNDVVLPALVYVQAKINARLKGETTAALLYDVNKERMRFYDVPRSFLAALWLQFAQAIEDDKKYRQCVVCESYFEVSPETGRATRKFCSDACRSRFYRQRQEAAQRLHHEGRTDRQIARELGTDVQTVRGWIEKKQGD